MVDAALLENSQENAGIDMEEDLTQPNNGDSKKRGRKAKAPKVYYSKNQISDVQADINQQLFDQLRGMLDVDCLSDPGLLAEIAVNFSTWVTGFEARRKQATIDALKAQAQQLGLTPADIFPDAGKATTKAKAAA